MLVLNRGVEEDVLIGDDIVIKVIRIKGGHVSLGIEAPRHVPVNRREVAEAIREAQKRQRSAQVT